MADHRDDCAGSYRPGKPVPDTNLLECYVCGARTARGIDGNTQGHIPLPADTPDAAVLAGVRFSIKRHRGARGIDPRTFGDAYPYQQMEADYRHFYNEAVRQGTPGRPVYQMEPDDRHVTIRNDVTRQVLRTYCTMPGCGIMSTCWACLPPRPNPLTDTSRWTLVGDAAQELTVRVGLWLPDEPGTPLHDDLWAAYGMTAWTAGFDNVYRAAAADPTWNPTND